MIGEQQLWFCTEVFHSQGMYSTKHVFSSKYSVLHNNEVDIHSSWWHEQFELLRMIQYNITIGSFSLILFSTFTRMQQKNSTKQWLKWTTNKRSANSVTLSDVLMDVIESFRSGHSLPHWNIWWTLTDIDHQGQAAVALVIAQVLLLWWKSTLQTRVFLHQSGCKLQNKMKKIPENHNKDF